VVHVGLDRAGLDAQAGLICGWWARPTGRLFDDVRAAAVPVVRQHTATELIALMRTLSPYHRMTAHRQAALEASIVALQEALGRPMRSTTAAVLVTARKVDG